MIDSQGKVFGRLNIIDLSLLIILAAMATGLLWAFLGQSPLQQKIKARGEAQVMVAIRGARFKDPEIFKRGEKVFLTIRNQRYEPVEVVEIVMRPREIVFLGANDKPVVVTDPTTPEVRDIDMIFAHSAEETDEGIVMGGHQLKVGNTVELDAFGYRFNGSIMKVDFKAQ
ncbi:MAG: hypothetical protein CVV27_12195 [Candidatus Melainabacteria bacterium HGW-Melainabacteria-1]|nr:MAG: hypothetical protein CVV27_12195 [Candidatus Melainabacteria bacterium HGW-Melainabacteria-1]